MRVTRTLTVRNRVFAINDLKRIAAVFDREAERSRNAKKHHLVSFQVTFEDEASIQSDSPDILDEEVLTGPSRPVKFRFRFNDYDDHRDLTFSIAHGDSRYGNELGVASDDQEWLKATYLTLKEAIESSRQQEFWWKKHPTILLHLIAIGIGSLIWLVLLAGITILDKVAALPIARLPDDSAWRVFINRTQPLFYLLTGCGVGFWGSRMRTMLGPGSSVCGQT